MSKVQPGHANCACPGGYALRLAAILLLQLHQQRRARHQVKAGLQPDQPAGAVQALQHTIHRRDRVLLALAYPCHLRRRIDLFGQHGVVAPLRVPGHELVQCQALMNRSHARRAAAQRQQRFRHALEALELGAVGGRQRLGIAAALRQAHRFAAQVFPAANAAALQEDRGAAVAVIGGRHMVQQRGALRRQQHAGNQQVNLALLEELHAVGRQHRHQLGLYRQFAGNLAREFGVEADGLAGARIDGTESAVAIDDHADGDLAALPDAIEGGVRLGRWHRAAECERQHGERHAAPGSGSFFHQEAVQEWVGGRSLASWYRQSPRCVSAGTRLQMTSPAA
ncbi:protein of unknown function (plasmid) [Cupriavidus taiwanensis]|uniref:Uncharacterized protein n=1 Tax=Cupriavidus taiwanensis TaxID=164546 RepID=A0A375ISR0_9BURK|nr:protein of unknown function [Cupriavidus taiwanensis]